MNLIEPQDILLPLSMRDDLTHPMGLLVLGEPDIALFKAADILDRYKLIMAVGDVTAEMLVKAGYNPSIIITDGKTKRQNIAMTPTYPQYEQVQTQSLPGTISRDSWLSIQDAAEKSMRGAKIHIVVEGEEDLLVLPMIQEAPEGAVVLYGQPNTGLVLVEVNDETKNRVYQLLVRMMDNQRREF